MRFILENIFDFGLMSLAASVLTINYVEGMKLRDVIPASGNVLTINNSEPDDQRDKLTPKKLKHYWRKGKLKFTIKF